MTKDIIGDHTGPHPHLRVVIYIDEAQNLAPLPHQQAMHKRTAYDHFLVAIDKQRKTCPGLFSLFLGTSAHISQLATSAHRSSSARARVGEAGLQAPITELPFDCHPGLFLKPEEFDLKKTSKISHLVMFGRPLSVSILLGHSSIAIESH